MPTFRCPRCSLDVAGRDRFQACKLCKFKGYFLPVGAPGAPLAIVEPAGAPTSPSMSPGEMERLRKARLAKSKQPTFVLAAHKVTAEEPERDALGERRKKRNRRGDGWLRNKLLRLLADGTGKRGDGPGLWQLIPPTSVVAVILAGTALGLILAVASKGGVAALRDSDVNFGLLTTLDLAGLITGWFEWWRHRGERWGLFARILGGLAAVLGGAYILVILIDTVAAL